MTPILDVHEKHNNCHSKDRDEEKEVGCVEHHFESLFHVMVAALKRHIHNIRLDTLVSSLVNLILHMPMLNC